MLALTIGPGLLFGLVLLAAIVGGHLAHLLRTPRVIGYLLSGIALRLGLQAIIQHHDPQALEHLEDAAKPLQAIKGLALGLILFTMGGIFERARMRAVAPRLWRISPFETTMPAAFVFVGTAAVLLLAPPAVSGAVTVTETILLAALLGLASIATAPAATLHVLQEYEAKGSTTETILALTGVNNLVCIVAFYAVFFLLVALGALRVPPAMTSQASLALAAATVGSIVLGISLGTMLCVVHAKLPLSETLLVFFAMMILLNQGEKWLHDHVGLAFNSLLASLIIGGVFANVAIDSQKLTNSLRTFGAPLIAGFFVLAGYSLHVEDLVHMSWLGAVYVVCRYGGKALACRIGFARSGEPPAIGTRVGGALMCQAAVVIGLAAFVTEQWQSPLASTFCTVVLGSVVVFELAGPLLVKRCVVLGGEVKAITLLRRAHAPAEGKPTHRVILAALGRLVGIGTTANAAHHRQITVEHIMRTNVQLIPADTSFEGVLHFIERSTHSHFPVVNDDGTLAGVIHFGDVREVVYDPALRDLVTAIDLAAADSTVVPLSMSLEELVDVFRHHNVAVLPVVESLESKRVVGLVEQRDLLRAVQKNTA